jgi:hypothetical protein
VLRHAAQLVDVFIRAKKGNEVKVSFRCKVKSMVSWPSRKPKTLSLALNPLMQGCLSLYLFQPFCAAIDLPKSLNVRWTLGMLGAWVYQCCFQ